MKKMRFKLGVVVATPGVIDAFGVSGEMPEGSLLPMLLYLERHQSGDWGAINGHDWRANDQALKEGTRLLSAYTLPGGRKVWIITEADRSATTILLPEEY